MAFIPLYPGEVDINSPAGESLFTKIKDNFDALYAGTANLLTLEGYTVNAATDKDIILDGSRDYRDRWINFKGMVYQGLAADLVLGVPGGTNDHHITSQATPTVPLPNINNLVPIDGWMYSSNGVAGEGVDPCLYFAYAGATYTHIWFWVAVTTGKLMMTVKTDLMNTKRDVLHYLEFRFSADLGGY
jgi:hypothetical protein